MSDYYDKGWEQFPFDINLYNWAMKGRQIATEKIHLLREYQRELRCGGTWFPGVNFLSNDLYGNIGNIPLPNKLLNFIKRHESTFDGIFDRAQVSICYPGYPKRMSSESRAAFNFRKNRFAAHIDGVLPIGKPRRRFLKEYHSFILGIPLNQTGKGAAPCVVWEGSHCIVKNEFRNYEKANNIKEWKNEDITEFYNNLRKKIFSSCKVKEIWVPMGHAYIINRLTLHGILPWKYEATGGGNSRMIAYFRPDLRNGENRWLE